MYKQFNKFCLQHTVDYNPFDYYEKEDAINNFMAENNSSDSLTFNELYYGII